MTYNLKAIYTELGNILLLLKKENPQNQTLIQLLNEKVSDPLELPAYKTKAFLLTTEKKQHFS